MRAPSTEPIHEIPYADLPYSGCYFFPYFKHSRFSTLCPGPSISLTFVCAKISSQNSNQPTSFTTKRSRAGRTRHVMIDGERVGGGYFWMKRTLPGCVMWHRVFVLFLLTVVSAARAKSKVFLVCVLFWMWRSLYWYEQREVVKEAHGNAEKKTKAN